MNIEKLDKVQERLEKEYAEIIAPYLKQPPKVAINDAYRLAHYNEIVDFFDMVDYEYPPFDEFIFDNILKYDGNIIEKIWKDWLDYSHPERFNFFTYEGLSDIILWSFKN